MKKILQKSAAMPDLRIIVLGCLALASVVAGSGEIIPGCLFSADCKTDDVRALAKDLKNLRDRFFAKQFFSRIPELIRCVGTIEMTKVEKKMYGCYDETMVKNSRNDCTIPCGWLFPDAEWLLKE